MISDWLKSRRSTVEYNWKVRKQYVYIYMNVWNDISKLPSVSTNGVKPDAAEEGRD